MKLSNFPFLTPDEFSQSCQGFIRLVDSCDDQLEPLGWANAGFDRSGPEAVLVVRRYIDKQAIHSTTKEIASDVGEKSTNTEDEEETEEYIEDDPVWQLFPIHKPSLVKSILTFDIQEALVRLPVSNSKCEVEYNVMLSPTYQVPVLYFFLPGGLPCGPKELPNIYNSLVPEQSRPGLRDVGVMGGVSITVSPRPILEFGFLTSKSKAHQKLMIRTTLLPESRYISSTRVLLARR
ncbi:Atg10p [Nannizzia gypsea CBS 118893]|uniref:Atg10p n=1 Tax=Arthroderma gypseum (strain ATCC MYA-4604 / CBS 118893) TaxID=535722 RepID=E4UWJ8_ARTGP|nr:Atg10p [Nannizzia gypsea CBS 118893]EFR01754.1 Atg10p [Nannizzia gypsea CBS 118893]